MKNSIRLAFASVCLLFVAGCAGTKHTAPMNATINTKCVISGEALKADSPTVDYMGKKIGFCCDHCVENWNKMSDAEKQAKLGAAK